jgi:YVTN family beta-propeller protein
VWWGKQGTLAVAAISLAVVALAAPVAVAQARYAYVADAGFGEVSVIDTDTGQVVGEPITTDKGTWSIALTPDGKFAFASNYSSNDVSVIDTETNQVVGEPIEVSKYGSYPNGVAISPDGKTAYVATETGLDAGQLVSIDVATRQVVGQPVELERRANALAVAPDGMRVYVSSGDEQGRVWLVYPQVDSVASWHIEVPGGRIGEMAITPDGKHLVVTHPESKSVSVIDTGSSQVIGPPIEVGAGARGLAISPDGNLAYAVGGNALSVIDLSANDQVIDEIPVPGGAVEIALSPSGDRAFVTTANNKVVVIDTEERQVIGEPIKVGTQAEGIAVVPDQAPIASFSGAPLSQDRSWGFNGAASGDPDGSIASYDWSFGDGQTMPNGGASATHAYDAPGTYPVSLTLTDNEGCSTALIFTGQTAYCNGKPSASQTQTVEVTAPAAARGTAFAARIARVKRGYALLRLRCRGTGRCHGTVRLQAGRMLIGTSRFAIPRGKSNLVRVKLNGRGRRWWLRQSRGRDRKVRLTGSGVSHRVVLLRP